MTDLERDLELMRIRERLAAGVAFDCRVCGTANEKSGRLDGLMTGQVSPRSAVVVGKGLVGCYFCGAVFSADVLKVKPGNDIEAL